MVASHEKVVLGCDLKRHVGEGFGNGLDPLRRRVHVARVPASPLVQVAHIGRHPSEPPLVVERPGQGFGFPEIPLDPREFCQREERVSQVEADIDGLLQRLASLGEMGQRRQRLLEVRERLPVGRAGEGLGPGLPEVGHRLLPRFAPQRVVGQPFDVLGQPVGIEPLDGLHDLAMEGAPPVLEQTAIGHVVGQGMLEGVLKVREDAGLVQELRALQPPDRGVQLVRGGLGNRLEQHERHVLPDHRRRLEQCLVPGR